MSKFSISDLFEKTAQVLGEKPKPKPAGQAQQTQQTQPGQPAPAAPAAPAAPTPPDISLPPPAPTVTAMPGTVISCPSTCEFAQNPNGTCSLNKIELIQLKDGVFQCSNFKDMGSTNTAVTQGGGNE